MHVVGIVSRDPFRGADHDQQRRNAAHAFRVTWREIAKSLDELGPQPGDKTSVKSVATDIRQKSDYLDGLSWIVLDRHERRAVTRVRRSIKSFTRKASRHPHEELEMERKQCLASMIEAEEIIGTRFFEIGSSHPAIRRVPNPIRVAVVVQGAADPIGVRLKNMLDGADGLSVVSPLDWSVDLNRNARVYEPDIVVLPTIDLLPLAITLRERNPNVLIIMLTTKPDDGELFESVRAGVSAYCDAEIEATELISIIRRCAAGEYVINSQLLDRPEVAARVIDYIRTTSTLADRQVD